MHFLCISDGKDVQKNVQYKCLAYFDLAILAFMINTRNKLLWAICTL